MKVISNFEKPVVVPEEGIKIASEKEPVIKQLFSNEIESILITENCIKKRIDFLAREIAEEYAFVNELELLVVLSGSFIFASDLARAVSEKANFSLKFSFIRCKSYGSAKKSSGNVEIVPCKEPKGKEVLIVEDIVDSGLTLEYIKRYLSEQKINYKVCALLDKGKTDQKVDFLGFKIPNKFVVGYGLDYAEKFRELPHIAVLKDYV